VAEGTLCALIGRPESTVSTFYYRTTTQIAESLPVFASVDLIEEGKYEADPALDWPKQPPGAGTKPQDWSAPDATGTP
jgi:hypothetical protein